MPAHLKMEQVQPERNLWAIECARANASKRRAVIARLFILILAVSSIWLKKTHIFAATARLFYVFSLTKKKKLNRLSISSPESIRTKDFKPSFTNYFWPLYHFLGGWNSFRKYKRKAKLTITVYADKKWKGAKRIVCCWNGNIPERPPPPAIKINNLSVCN